MRVVFIRRTSSDVNESNPPHKRQKQFSHEELHNMEMDALISQAFATNPQMDEHWDKEDLWCRYCGARASIKWLNSPWGDKKLCNNHGTLWKEGILPNSHGDIAEPQGIESVIAPNENTEKGFLINEIMKGSSVRVHGLRKSVRNMKREREECSSESSFDDEDENEPFAQSDCNNISINVGGSNERMESQNPHISSSDVDSLMSNDDDDDLAIGVD